MAGQDVDSQFQRVMSAYAMLCIDYGVTDFALVFNCERSLEVAGVEPASPVSSYTASTCLGLSQSYRPQAKNRALRTASTPGKIRRISGVRPYSLYLLSSLHPVSRRSRGNVAAFIYAARGISSLVPFGFFDGCINEANHHPRHATVYSNAESNPEHPLDGSPCLMAREIVGLRSVGVVDNSQRTSGLSTGFDRKSSGEVKEDQAPLRSARADGEGSWKMEKSEDLSSRRAGADCRAWFGSPLITRATCIVR